MMGTILSLALMIVLGLFIWHGGKIRFSINGKFDKEFELYPVKRFVKKE